MQMPPENNEPENASAAPGAQPPVPDGAETLSVAAPRLTVPRPRRAFEPLTGAVQVSGLQPHTPSRPAHDAQTLTTGTAHFSRRARFEDLPRAVNSAGPSEATRTFDRSQLPGGAAHSLADHTMTGGLNPTQDFPLNAQPVSNRIADAAQMWKVGDVIDGKYEVLAIAGQGGMGVVYRVRHREWNLEMAVKTPLPAMVRDAAAKARFFREAQTWVDLGLHPNLVQCWFVRELGGLPRVFVDYLSGGSLKDWFVEGRVKAGQYERIIDLMAQACDGLGYAHDRGVVHRDVKPGNMLLSDDGRLCITDFGLVKLAGVDDIAVTTSGQFAQSAAGSAPELTSAGVNLGTPQYGAPEQWGSAHAVDARADIYALGITLYELCCGRRPFDQPGKPEPAQILIARHLGSTPPDPRSLRKDLPESLAALILKCLEKSPQKRPGSLLEVREALQSAHQEIYGRPLARPVPEAAESRASGLNNRAVSMWDLGQPAQAAAAWQEALALDPHHAESLYNSSLVEYRAGKITDLDAEQRLREAAKIQRKAQLYLGHVRLETCDAPAAQQSFETALRDPALATDGFAWRSLGHAMMAQEKFREAEAAYLKTLEIMPQDADARKGAELARRHVRTAAGRIQYPQISPRQAIDERVGSIRALAAAPDGRSIFCDGALNTLSQFEIPTGKLLGTFAGLPRQILTLAVSPDGSFVLCGGEDAQLHAWHCATRAPLDDFYGKGHIGSILSIAISPDSRRAVTAGGDKSVRVWNIQKGALLKTLWGHEEAVHAVALAPCGTRIASGSLDGTIRIWDFASYEPLAELREALTPVRALAYSEDGKALYSAGSDGVVLQWDTATLKPLCTFRGHRGTVNALNIVPGTCGRLFVTGGDDGTLRLWDAAAGRCLRTVQGHKGAVLALALPVNAGLLVSGATENLGQPLRLWNFELERFLRAPDDRDLFAASMAICRIEKLEQSQSASRAFNALMERATGEFISENFGASYLTLLEARAIGGFERDPRALELTARLSKKLPLKSVAAFYPRAEIEGRHTQGFKAVLFSADEKSAFSAGRNDKIIQCWELESGACVRKLEGHKQAIEGLALVPGQPLLVSASSDYSLALWDLAAGTLKSSFLGHTRDVNAVAVSRDGRLLASASSDCSVRVWELSSGRCVKTFERDGSEEPLVAVQFTLDGRHILCGGRDGYLAHCSLATGRTLMEFAGHFGSIHALAVLKDKAAFISAGEDKTLRCWNIETGECMWKVMDGKSRFQAIAISPDQQFIFTGGLEQQDTQVKIWDAASGQPRGAFCPHARGITALALNSDGTVLMTASEDKYLRLFDLEWALSLADFKSASVPATAARAPSSPHIKRVSLTNISAIRPAASSALHRAVPSAPPRPASVLLPAFEFNVPPAAPVVPPPGAVQRRLSVFLESPDKKSQ